MKPSIVRAIYFSPTGTSRSGAVAIAKALDENAEEIDVTVAGRAPERISFAKDELIVFGAPVYGGRLYRGAVERFQQFTGHKTPCIVTVTYGNRDFDDALLELKELAEALGFVPVAAAALIGQHTYGQIQVGRPNESDLKEDREFADRIKAILEQNRFEGLEVPGNYPYKDGGHRGKFRPQTTDACTHCGVCVRECPELAIDPENPEKIDDSRCIACFRCIKVCPVGAKNPNTPEYVAFAEGFTKKLEKRRENQYFLPL
ncbi:4Fe-4S binding protein [Hominifimenecus sp. rT4P-3]|uniref:4Fe-4S binding protein n=1 Tax=Hominifimenecus sp. rT4P-3 TaxID=3242979 RepID=UPI003DA1ED32